MIRSSYSNTRGCTDLLVALQEDLMYRYLDPLVALQEELRRLLQEDLNNNTVNGPDCMYVPYLLK